MIIHCPTCRGVGHMHDGACIISHKGVQMVKQNSQCLMCRGKRFVSVEPASDEEIGDWHDKNTRELDQLLCT